MPRIKADRLKEIGSTLLQAAGATAREAEAVAGGCVNANLAGHDSHGIVMVPNYIERIKVGHIVPGGNWTIVQESPTTTVPARADCFTYFKIENGKITTNWPGYATEYRWRTRAVKESDFEFVGRAMANA